MIVHGLLNVGGELIGHGRSYPIMHANDKKITRVVIEKSLHYFDNCQEIWIRINARVRKDRAQTRKSQI